MSSDSQWAVRARRLSYYRRRLLQERHGTIGGALRYFRDALADLLFGICARYRLSTTITPENCDFLFLEASPRLIRLKRKNSLITTLSDGGRSFVETSIPERLDILKAGLLKKPPQFVPLRYFGYAAYADWIVAKYSPRILLNDRNGSFYTPFLRMALNAQGGKLIHLAHATTVEQSRKLGMNDYDYYFLFGQSSLDELRSRHLRFGSSLALLSGSYMIDTRYEIAPATPDLRVLLILGVGPDREKEYGYQRTYQLLHDWTVLHPEYHVLFKAHPRSKNSFWSKAKNQLANVENLPAFYSLADALARASVVVNIMSNAVMEAALAGRPVIPVCLSNDEDIFSQTRFFGERVANIAGLQARIADIEANYSTQVDKAREFANCHLAYGVHGLENTAKALQALFLDEDPHELGFHVEPLPEAL